jgi:hypothetical protein
VAVVVLVVAFGFNDDNCGVGWCPGDGIGGIRLIFV